MNIQLQNLEIKGDTKFLDFQTSKVSSKYFISAWQLVTDLIGIFNADSRKGVSKFSGLRWFLLFEDLYNEEGYLQANKTIKKHQNLNLKQ